MTEAIRTAIAAAASTVDGVNVTPYFRQVARPGEGVVRKDRTTYPDPVPFGGIDTWQVLIVIPQDLATSERWLEDHQDALVDALEAELIIRSVTPKELVTTPGPNPTTVPVVVIEGDRGPE